MTKQEIKEMLIEYLSHESIDIEHFELDHEMRGVSLDGFIIDQIPTGNSTILIKVYKSEPAQAPTDQPIKLLL